MVLVAVGPERRGFLTAAWARASLLTGFGRFRLLPELTALPAEDVPPLLTLSIEHGAVLPHTEASKQPRGMYLYQLVPYQLSKVFFPQTDRIVPSILARSVHPDFSSCIAACRFMTTRTDYYGQRQQTSYPYLPRSISIRRWMVIQSFVPVTCHTKARRFFRAPINSISALPLLLLLLLELVVVARELLL